MAMTSWLDRYPCLFLFRLAFFFLLNILESLLFLRLSLFGVDAVAPLCAVVSVLTVGHLGHSAGRLWPGQRFTLEDQIQHKVRFMHWLKTRLPDTRFVLVGHSIGCYIALQVSVLPSPPPLSL